MEHKKASANALAKWVKGETLAWSSARALVGSLRAEALKVFIF